MNIQISTSGLEPYAEAIAHERLRFTKEGLIIRIRRHDHTVWKKEDHEISNRLDWLEGPRDAVRSISEWADFADEIRSEGFTQALLLGMGGSSLAPEVFSRVFGPAANGLRLAVLDSTDPAAVLRSNQRLTEGKTLFIVSSKSGTTLETASFLNYFFTRTVERFGRKSAGRSFIAITDPGSFLVSEARRLDFRRIFPGNPNIGGRFSALSPFGLIPATLLGLDLRAILTSANKAALTCRRRKPGENPGADLGIILGTLACAGRDKAVYHFSPAIDGLGAWIEQLVAESTGKEGRGLLPIVRPTEAPTIGPTNDRFHILIGLSGDETLAARAEAVARSGDPVVSMTLANVFELGAQFYLWEFATAVAGAILGINPFDQPNVALSKKKSEAALKAYVDAGKFPPEVPSWEDGSIAFHAENQELGLGDGLRWFFDRLEPAGYVSIQAFLPPFPEVVEAVRTLAGAIERRQKQPVSFDFGPRYLHSTGQLHKGDSGRGLFLQLTADHPKDAAVPLPPDCGESFYSFGNLIDSQSLGDRQALREKGRQVARLHFKNEISGGIIKAAKLLS